MLISSRSFRGRCPVCGAANCACGGPSTVVPVDQRITEAKVGKVVVVQLRPGVGIRMLESEARAKGLLPPENKMQEPAPNKARKPRQNKGA